MKKIKNILCVFSEFLLVLGLTVCGGNKNIEGTLEEIMEKVYVDIPEDQRPMMLGNIDPGNLEFGYLVYNVYLKDLLVLYPLPARARVEGGAGRQLPSWTHGLSESQQGRDGNKVTAVLLERT